MFKVKFLEWAQNIHEAAETLAADVNEILVGYHALGGKWTGFEGSGEAKKQLKQRKEQIGDEAYNIQDERAQAMVKEIMKWAKANGYKGKITKAWWTARPGILSKAVGTKVDSKKNPTDTLLQFADGKFLGISAKSSKQNIEITFKNPGLGTVDKDLGTDIRSFVKKQEDQVIKKHKLPQQGKERKEAIRSDEKIQTKTKQAGLAIMTAVRDQILKTLKSLNKRDPEEARQYLLKSWMDTGDGVYPPYIKVTGRHGGAGKKATADIVDPIENPKLDAVLQMPITFVPLGSDSIGVQAKGKRIMKARVKYESEKIASSLKLSVEGWK
jgi:hypothetical protein